MLIKIKRIRIRGHTTDGVLSIDDQPFCETAESTPNMMEAGLYHIRHTSRIFACGNGAYHRTDSRILVGQTLVPGIVLQTRETYYKLYERIRKSISRGDNVLLIIQ